MTRKPIPLKIQLAAALLQLPTCDISHADAKSMSAETIRSRFHLDHYPVRVAEGGPDEPWNLTWLLVKTHRDKTRKIDIPEISKSKRIRRKEAAHRGAIALARLGVSPLPQPARHKRKILSRPFPTRHK